MLETYEECFKIYIDFDVSLLSSERIVASRSLVAERILCAYRLELHDLEKDNACPPIHASVLNPFNVSVMSTHSIE